MCTVCGCGDAQVEHTHDHDHDHDHDHHHDHGHGHHHHHGEDVHFGRHGEDVHFGRHGEDVHFGKGIAGVHVPGLSQSRIIQIEQDILGHNKSLADVNRAWLAERGIFALNLVSSPGSGKTTLLCKTVEALAGRYPLAVIEGDQQTSNDADRIRATGAPAIQVNTGKGCHLDAHMVATAFERLKPAEDSVLFIENVGNLVCPAAFDLGEAYKVAILSVTEGEDKPLKYPDMFAAASMMILNKVDLLPYLDFDVAQCIEYARRVNPDIVVLQVSARSGQGMDEWLAWVNEGRRRAIAAKVTALKAKLAAAEAALGQ